MKTMKTITRRISVLATIICCAGIAAALPGCGGSSAGSGVGTSGDADDDAWGEDGSLAGGAGHVDGAGSALGSDPSGRGQNGPHPDAPNGDEVEPDVLGLGQPGTEDLDAWGTAGDAEEDHSGQGAQPDVATEEELASSDEDGALQPEDDEATSPDEPDGGKQDVGSGGPDQPLDSDKDGLSDDEEETIGTDPNKKDTDSDGFDDPAELKLGLDPLKQDDPAAFCEDGDACTKDGWSNSAMACQHAPVSCDDANPCTQDQCSSEQGCLYVFNTAPCEDGDLCTQGDSCKLGVCQPGAIVSCDDADACTNDICDPKEGCKHKALSDSPCDDGDPCTTGDHCVAGSCKPGSVYLCGSCKSDFDCADFDDDDLCNGTMVCIDGLCTFDKDSIVQCQDSGKECIPSLCEPASGKCLPTKAADGSECGLLDASVALAQCLGGKCIVVAQKDCDDGNPCTIDLHDSETGCKHEVQTGASCKDDISFSQGETCGEDGFCLATGSAPACMTDSDCLVYDDTDKCNGTVSCQDGHCVKGPMVSCKKPSKPCMESVCMPATGKCIDSPVSDGQTCEDGSLCSQDNSCVAGKCVGGTPVDCDDGNPCTADFCEPAWGCRHLNGSGACDDGNFCTYNDKCKDGVCIGTQDGGCCEKDPDCDDGDACNGIEKCVAGTCKGGVPKKCPALSPDLDPQCASMACDPTDGQCKPTSVKQGKSCDDQDKCTESDKCLDGLCVGKPIAAEAYDDGQVCTDDLCDPLAGPIHPFNFAACDDGDKCTKADQCNGSGVCVGQAVSVPPASPCEKWLCDAYSGKLTAVPLPDGTPCSDSDACTLNDQCQDGLCVKGKVVTAADCNDGNPCTKDYCDPEVGCTHAPSAGICDDKDPCTVGDVCKMGSCVGEPKSCASDGNPCTKDYCDPASGCVYQPLTLGAGSCSDSNACTDGDFCKAGECLAGKALGCNDKNPCTKDWCDPTLGCVNDPLTLPPTSCDDSNPCTADDQCVFGKCKGFKPVDPDDGNPCTKDYCDPASGIQHAPLTLAPGSCEDGKVCTLLDRCIDGKCVPGKPDAADDGNLCTEDLCAEGVGQIHIELSVDDGNPCTDDTCYPDVGIVHVVNITDWNPCTLDFCNPSEGPFHVAVDDGTACYDGDQCTVTQCQAGQCVTVGKTSCVDDKNECTADYCDPATPPEVEACPPALLSPITTLSSITLVDLSLATTPIAVFESTAESSTSTAAPVPATTP